MAILKKDDLFKAIFSDSLDIVSGLLIPVPIPRELIRIIYEKMRRSPANDFINTNHEDLLNYYNGDDVRFLELTFGNETEFLPQHVVIDNTVKRLHRDQFVFKFDTTIFELSRELRDKTHPAFKKLINNIAYNNGENLRLFDVELVDDKYIFHTQPVYYETYLHTNMVVDYEPKARQSIRSLVHPQGKLEQFKYSLLANHIGINILIFTPTGDLILPMRSKEVSYAPTELAASISGAVSTLDVINGEPIHNQAILREGIEELGLKRNEVIQDSIKFLGLTRELVRGGKPEIFFTMRTNLSYDMIVDRWKQAEDHWESTKLIYFPFGEDIHHPFRTKKDRLQFEERINTFFHRLGSTMSLPLITNLSLWMEMKRSGQ